jgi:HAD superfamily hydrolase (TIGR01484 family)
MKPMTKASTRYLALATDYDGTLATDGQVDNETLAALERLRAFGKKLILVTGRLLDDLQQVFPQYHYCDCIVAENGPLLYFPASGQQKLLANQPPSEFIQALQKRGVHPLSAGKVIVATWHPQETTVQEVIRQLRLELQVIYNKGAVMVLPNGIDKATGLIAALEELNLSPLNVIGIGDAENDLTFVCACGYSVAVANALPMLKEQVDFVTNASRGAGVVELIDKWLASDLAGTDLP